MKKFAASLLTTAILAVTICTYAFSSVQFAVAHESGHHDACSIDAEQSTQTQAHTYPTEPIPTPENFPEIMKAKGQAIAPLCLKQCCSVENTFHNIEKCPITGLTSIKTHIDVNGFIRTEYQYSVQDDFTAFTAYKPIGMLGEDIAIQFIDNTGSSKTLTSLSLYERKDNTMAMKKKLVSGELCNKGIERIDSTNGNLVYIVNLTPYDLMTLAIPKTELKAYKDLETRATSCFAKATYENTELTKVILSSQIENENDADWNSQYTHQTCYNALHRAYISEELTTLSAQDFIEFGKKFKEICLSEKETQNE